MCGVHLWEGGGGAGRIFAHLTKLEPSLRFSDSFLALYSHRFIVFVEPLSLANLNKSLLHLQPATFLIHHNSPCFD
jgi:hypothetical protein